MSDKLAEYELLAPNSFRAPISELTKRSSALKKRIAAAIPNVPEERVFTFEAEISNQNIDSYFTRMAESSLRNYAADAQTGVAFLIGHDHQALPTGYSLDGQYIPDAVNGPRVVADFYTIRDYMMSNDFIMGVEANLVRDVSIGFKEGEDFAFNCSVCGLSMWDWDCMHIPGMKYDVVQNPQDDPSIQRTIEELCYAWVENAGLSEVSGVFDGATPGAMIVKATRELRAGRLRPDVQRMLESAYRIQLPKARTIVPVGDPNPNREVITMADKDETSGAPDKRAIELNQKELRFEATACGVKVESDDDERSVVGKMRQEIERLRPFERQADEGSRLRKILVDETIAEGVRAFGNDFDENAKRTMLDGLDVDVVCEMRDSWKSIADKVLPKGRSTTDDAEPEAPGAPDEAAQAATVGGVPVEAQGGV